MDSRKKFMLHACCAPCSIAVIDELRQGFDLTVYFFNPNIHPLKEYLKRKAEVVKVCGEWNVSMIDGDYEPAKWAQVTRGLETEPEGGARCSKCFFLRLENTARMAVLKSQDFFGTTLTMGRQKNSKAINEIGTAIGEQFGVPFYAEDWKKKGRYEKRNAMVKERGIYVQSYCGCVYSLKNSIKRNQKLNNSQTYDSSQIVG